jgi:hypothetical protein
MSDVDPKTLGGSLVAGLVIGVAIGFMFDHLILGVTIGLGLGVLAAVLKQSQQLGWAVSHRRASLVLPVL